MKFNNKELADLSLGEATIEGRLHYRKLHGGYSQSVYKEKWFKLRANILYYFNHSETGHIFDKKPTGAFILENVIVQYEMNSEVPFSFSLYFNNEAEKKHLFSGRTEENIKKWVEALKEASYEYWRSRLILLQEKLRFITGLDPLLMYPRNEGCKLAFKENSELAYKGTVKTLAAHSKSQFYAVEDSQCDNSEGNIASKHDNFSKSDASSVLPVRPARGNKAKFEVECTKLIDY